MTNKQAKWMGLILIIGLEVIGALAINLFHLSDFYRYAMAILAIISVLLYRQTIRRTDAKFLILIGLGLGYSLTMVLTTSAYPLWSLISVPCGLISALIVGAAYSQEKKQINNVMIAIYGALGVLFLISLLYTCYAFGFFYRLRFSDVSVAERAKLFFGFAFPDVHIPYFSYGLCLLSSGLSVLWFDPRGKSLLHRLALAGGIIGLLGNILLPYWPGLILSLGVLAISAIIRFYPRTKKALLIGGLLAGCVMVLGIVIIMLKGQSITRVRVIISVVKQVFQYPLGRMPLELLEGTPNTRNIFVDALFQGGLIPCLALVGFFTYGTIMMVRYWKKTTDEPLIKGLISSFLIAYFIYVNLNYSEEILIEYGDRLPFYLDPMMTIVFLLVGYMSMRYFRPETTIDLSEIETSPVSTQEEQSDGTRSGMRSDGRPDGGDEE